jgi:phage recombination protein Bet
MNAPARLPTTTQGGAIFALTTKLASHFDMVNVDPQELVETLKQTAFRTPQGAVPSDAQMTALLVVANQYQLNPWTKEIYAFPAKGGGIVPIVGVDGWANIINSHPQFDGMEFEYDHGEGGPKGLPVSVTCVIYRKDRTRPTKVTEFFDECYRNTEPWNAMKRRMLRHKAMIQCGRIAFGYGGIHDPEEGEQIAGEKFMGQADVVQPGAGQASAHQSAAALPEWTDAELDKRESKMREFFAKGKTSEDVIAFYSTKATLSDAQKKRIRDLSAKCGQAAASAGSPPAQSADQAQDVTPKVTFASVADRINKAGDLDQLADAGTFIGEVADEQQRRELNALYEGRHNELSGKE